MLKELLSRHHPRRLGRKLRKSIDKRLGKMQAKEVAAMQRELALRVSAVEQSFDQRLSAVEQRFNQRLSATDGQLLLVEQHHTSAFWHVLDKIYDHTLTDKALSCVICGHSGQRSDFEVHVTDCWLGGRKLERYECPTCECIFGAQKFLDLDDALVGLEYRLLYTRIREQDYTKEEVRTFRSLNPKNGSAYVNWGCGAWNQTVALMREEGWNFWGYDPSAPLNAPFVVREKAQLPEGLAGLMSNNVIEHFLDPVAQFREFHDVLPPGGRMAHSTPCYDFRYANTRFHVVFLVGKSPEILAERTGFKVVDRIRDGEYINYVFEKCAV
jgi:hypothetical protein